MRIRICTRKTGENTLAVVSRMEHYHADDNLDEMKRFTVRNKGA